MEQVHIWSHKHRKYAHVLDAVSFQYLRRDGQQHLPVDKTVPEYSTICFERLGRHPVADLFHGPVHNWNLVDFGGWIRYERRAILWYGQMEFTHDEDRSRVDKRVRGTGACSKSTLRKSVNA